jgi:glutamate formiminotransferase/formiminotetrahydrofolate cyclodeaminase
MSGLGAARGEDAGTEMRPYAEWPIAAYLEKLASESPEPGGGSVAALVGALAAALLSMVANLTLGNEKYASAHEEIGQLGARAAQLRAELEQLVTLDAKAYAAVASAMKLPKDTEAQKEGRTAALQTALKGAAAVPAKIAEAALEAAKLSLPAAEKGNVNAVSDAGVAVILAEAAAQAAALNVKINVTWIDDKDFGRVTWANIEAVLSEAARLRDVVLALTYGKL